MSIYGLSMYFNSGTCTEDSRELINIIYILSEKDLSIDQLKKVIRELAYNLRYVCIDSDYMLSCNLLFEENKGKHILTGIHQYSNCVSIDYHMYRMDYNNIGNDALMIDYYDLIEKIPENRTMDLSIFIDKFTTKKGDLEKMNDDKTKNYIVEEDNNGIKSYMVYHCFKLADVYRSIISDFISNMIPVSITKDNGVITIKYEDGSIVTFRIIVESDKEITSMGNISTTR